MKLKVNDEYHDATIEVRITAPDTLNKQEIMKTMKRYSRELIIRVGNNIPLSPSNEVTIEDDEGEAAIAAPKKAKS